MSPVHQVWPKPSCKAQWKGEEDKADRGRGGKTTSGNGQAWSSPSPRGQWKTDKWRKLVAKSSVVSQRPSRLRDSWDDEMRVWARILSAVSYLSLCELFFESRYPLPTPFKLFFCLFLSLWPFQLYFIPWILPKTLRFLTLFFRSYFCLILSFQLYISLWKSPPDQM